MDLSNGTQQTVYGGLRAGESFTARAGLGGTWNAEGTILFFRGASGILRISAAGGEASPVPGVDQPPQGVLYRWPHFLPDGHHFLYLVTTAPPAAPQETSEIYLASLDGKQSKRLLSADSNAMYAGSPDGGGYLLFARDGALVAQPFDASSLTLTGEPFRVAEQVRVNPNNRGFFSVSDSGALVYDPSGAGGNNQLVWFDRAGKALEPVGSAGIIRNPRLSPDGKRVAMERQNPQTGTDDIYVIDLERGASSRLTIDPASDSSPIWSPDGSRIAWASSREGVIESIRSWQAASGPRSCCTRETPG